MTELDKIRRLNSRFVLPTKGVATPLRWWIQQDSFEGVAGTLYAPGSLGALQNGSRLLSGEFGYAEGLSTIFGMNAVDEYPKLLAITSARLSKRFLTDDCYRDWVLNKLCASMLATQGLLLIDPPAISVRGSTRFLDRRLKDQPLQLCHLFGSVGFAQVCDDMLGRPIPLLMRPWSPGCGLLKPIRPPRKSFSQHLLVTRVGKRGLILLDKRCVR